MQYSAGSKNTRTMAPPGGLIGNHNSKCKHRLILTSVTVYPIYRSHQRQRELLQCFFSIVCNLWGAHAEQSNLQMSDSAGKTIKPFKQIVAPQLQMCLLPTCFDQVLVNLLSIMICRGDNVVCVMVNWGWLLVYSVNLNISFWFGYVGSYLYPPFFVHLYVYITLCSIYCISTLYFVSCGLGKNTQRNIFSNRTEFIS